MTSTFLRINFLATVPRTEKGLGRGGGTLREATSEGRVVPSKSVGNRFPRPAVWRGFLCGFRIHRAVHSGNPPLGSDSDTLHLKRGASWSSVARPPIDSGIANRTVGDAFSRESGLPLVALVPLAMQDSINSLVYVASGPAANGFPTPIRADNGVHLVSILKVRARAVQSRTPDRRGTRRSGGPDSMDRAATGVQARARVGKAGSRRRRKAAGVRGRNCRRGRS